MVLNMVKESGRSSYYQVPIKLQQEQTYNHLRNKVTSFTMKEITNLIKSVVMVFSLGPPVMFTKESTKTMNVKDMAKCIGLMAVTMLEVGFVVFSMASVKLYFLMAPSKKVTSKTTCTLDLPLANH